MIESYFKLSLGVIAFPQPLCMQVPNILGARFHRHNIHMPITMYDFFAFQVLFPSGAKVAIFRNFWGIDVNVYTPRAKNIANEEGLCFTTGVKM